MKNIHYILCSEGRSGTNYLRYLLIKFCLGEPSEIEDEDINLDVIPVRYRERFIQWKHKFLRSDRYDNDELIGNRSLWEFPFDFVIRHRSEGLIYSRCVWSYQFEEIIKNLRGKAGALDVSDADLLEHIYPGIKFIYLYREDHIKQAISMEKARQTDQWNSFQRVQNFDPEYKFGKIAQEVIWRLDSVCKWKEIFERYGIEPLRVKYEDFCKAPRKWLLRIKRYLGIRNATPITEEAIRKHMEDEKAPQRQSDDTNTEWEKRFYQDLERLKQIS